MQCDKGSLGQIHIFSVLSKQEENAALDFVSNPPADASVCRVPCPVIPCASHSLSFFSFIFSFLCARRFGSGVLNNIHNLTRDLL